MESIKGLEQTVFDKIYTLEEAWRDEAKQHKNLSIKDINRHLNERVGAKAGNLARLKHFNFRVPDGFILDKEIFRRIMKEHRLWGSIRNELKALYLTNISLVSKRILATLESLDLDSLKQSIIPYLDPKKTYAVRSSAILEDLEDQSFAGQYDTVLHCSTADEVIEAVKTCYRSLYSESNLHYVVDHHLPIAKLQMAILVQEMVDAECSGVVFTVNPVSGIDTEILAEVTSGVAEGLVAGQVNGERYLFDWKKDEWLDIPSGRPILGPYLREILMQEALALQVHFGRPQDIEFCFYLDHFYVVQSRPVSSIQFQGYDSVWTTADFKDGGVSSTVCKPYMWSLYEYIWERKLRDFIIDGRILKESQLPERLSIMAYARPYWNLSFVKYALSKIPGYVEKDFDQEYGIQSVYKGRGETTKLNPGSLYHVGKIAWALKRIQKEQAHKLENFLDERKERYQQLLAFLDNDEPSGKLAVIWYQLTKFEYMETEGTYFQQIFLNTVYQSLYKDKICEYLSDSEYLSLLGGLDNISHLRPFYAMWTMSRTIRKSEQLSKYWEEDTETISSQYLEEPDRYPGLAQFFETFGYHSDRELDVSYPNYIEDPRPIVQNIKQLLTVEDEEAPFDEQEKQRENYQAMREKLAAAVGPKNQAKLLEVVDNMREMLWWREELRDISSMYYHLIRLYTMEIAKLLVEENALDHVEDVWFVKLEDLWAYFDNPEEVDLRSKITTAKEYYYSFAHCQNPNEIGRNFTKRPVPHFYTDEDHFAGLGCNQGVVTARARVVYSFEEMDTIEPGEILVTKFTDTGWTPKFAILAGVITEYGGLLCHAAIVSREYGLPCIVHLDGATEKIKNGSLITMDGATGEVIIEKEILT